MVCVDTDPAEVDCAFLFNMRTRGLPLANIVSISKCLPLTCVSVFPSIAPSDHGVLFFTSKPTCTCAALQDLRAPERCAKLCSCFTPPVVDSRLHGTRDTGTLWHARAHRDECWWCAAQFPSTEDDEDASSLSDNVM